MGYDGLGLEGYEGLNWMAGSGMQRDIVLHEGLSWIGRSGIQRDRVILHSMW